MIKISKTWSRWADNIQKQIDEKGIENWDQFYEINLNIEVYESTHYKKYFNKCKEYLFPGIDNPHIIEFGAGYGGMVEFWKEGFSDPQVTHIDIKPMLDIQKYHLTRSKLEENVEFIDTTLVDETKVDFSGAYFFSTFAFTETTPNLWEYYINNVFPYISAAYIYGSKGWSEDHLLSFDWGKLHSTFDNVVIYNDNLILGGVPGVEIVGHNSKICKCNLCRI